MFRFYYVIMTNIFFMLHNLARARYMVRHSDRYSEEDRYRLVRKIMDRLRRRSHTVTTVYGTENLPDDGGYILYSNHQGKYDALGIMLSHEKPLSALMELHNSEKFATNTVMDLMEGKRIDQQNPRQQLQVLRELGEEVRAGRRFVIFPEGKYGKNRNHLQPFQDGCFYSALVSRRPIVPVCIVDSWKAMNQNHLRREETEVHFLEPIPYETFRGMKRSEISRMVKERISACLAERTEARAAQNK